MFKNQIKYEPVVNITANVDTESINVHVDFIYIGNIIIKNENAGHS